MNIIFFYMNLFNFIITYPKTRIVFFSNFIFNKFILLAVCSTPTKDHPISFLSNRYLHNSYGFIYND